VFSLQITIESIERFDIDRKSKFSFAEVDDAFELVRGCGDVFEWSFRYKSNFPLLCFEQNLCERRRREKECEQSYR
jgi:hypothetical protein